MTKSKKCQIKLKINKITCNSPEKIGYSPVYKKAWYQLDKKNRNFKARKFADFLKKKTINFKVMKTIRNQINYPIGLQLPMLL